MKDSIEVLDLKKSYSGNQVLKGVNLELKSGEILGLVGTNGAGKSTLMSLIVGLKKQYQGDIRINGSSLKNMGANNEKRIGCLIEYPGLYPGLTGFENLDYFSSFIGKEQKSNIQHIIRDLNLESFIHKKVKKYSLGMKQRLAIGISLLGSPNYLILDEPMSGIDAEARPGIRNVLQKLVKERNMGIMVSSHILSELELLCDRVAILKDGVIIETIDLKSRKTSLKNNYLISSSDPNKIYNFLVQKNYLVKKLDEKILVMLSDGNSEDLLNKLINNGMGISGIVPYEESLEERFIDAVDRSV